MTPESRHIGRVAFVCDIDTGGAATAAQRMAEVLASQGVETAWMYGEARPSPFCFSALQWPNLSRYVAYRVACAMPGSEIRREFWRRLSISSTVVRAVRGFRPDVISVHNIHKTMDIGVVERLTAIAPVVWTLHDMWALTGYCCYSHECQQFERGCGRICPEAGKWGPVVSSAQVGWRRRQGVLQRTAGRLAVVSPSAWLLECSKARELPVCDSRKIANGCDLNVFRPLGDKRVVRSLLGLLARETKVVLIGGQSLDDKRKGASKALAAIQKLAEVETLTVLTFGGDAPTLVSGANLTFHHLGPVGDDRYLNLVYNAADVFVLPTDADNLPNTLVESMAAGTPCVAFDVGGCCDVIDDGETGRLVAPGDVESLSRAISDVLCLSPDAAESMRHRCRQKAENEFNIEKQSSEYLAFMEQLLESTA